MRTHMLMVVLPAMLAGLSPAADKGADPLVEVTKLWLKARTLEANSTDLPKANRDLEALLASLPAARRAAAAAAMMDDRVDPRLADSRINAAALELFGNDPLPIADVQRILWDADRSTRQRELLKTYYSFCQAEAKTSILSEDARRQLVDILAERLDNLAGTKVDYGEQRLLAHLCMAVLSRYAQTGEAGEKSEQSEKVPQAQKLRKAMEKYAERADKADGLGAAMVAWLDLASEKAAGTDELNKAIRALGHWDAVTRLKAAADAAELARTDAAAAKAILALLDDPRDEAKAVAARVFGFIPEYGAEVIVPRMIEMLCRDRSVVVQAAAADVLVSRAAQAATQIEPLIKVINDPVRIPGRTRASCILLVLSKLVKYAAPDQKDRILVAAVRCLGDSSSGALAVMEALGPEARKAIPSIREYRAAADRFERAYIDRHVLPSILLRPPGESRPAAEPE